MRSVAFSEYLIFSLLLIQELPSASQNAPTTSSSPPVIPTTAPPQPTTVSEVTDAPTEPSVPHTGTSSRTTRHTGSTTPYDNISDATTAWTEPTTTSEYVTHDGRIGQAILVLLSCLGITLGAVNMIFAWLMHTLRVRSVVEKLELADKRMGKRAFSDEILGLLQSIGFDANKYEAEASAYISQFNSQY
ncbi:unnamed protein product [Bursaphelenchus xylophilus]|uniref:(pine wood nematode) hypothetical protein n=1 Tax=Bursaphelenchus xylophilus TaxID=6326 RepID=A0A1I7SGM5_BURXY|nr:unnamed protein product [Bursaphelenchus xylophilus]CAG9081646.1 unnamed protein product [Bursaphelenchus xylophilus]